METPMFESAADQFAVLYRAWLKAVDSHDLAWFERTLADDFVEVIFMQEEDGTRRTVELDKAELISFYMGVGSCPAEALAIDARVVGDYAVSWLLATDVVVLSKNFDEKGAAVAEKLGMEEEIGQTVDGGVALFSSSWRRKDGDWSCFSHEFVGAVGS